MEAMAQVRTARDAERMLWPAAALVLLAAGWGSNQFTPMLLVYHRGLGLGTGTLEAMFGVYALGMVPGMLLGGPLSDARGRRAVVVPAVALSLLGTLSLIAGADTVPLLFAGRLLVGFATGAVFAAGTAWLRELSALSGPGGGDPALSARRATVAMAAGFALGPLVAGTLAQWAPLPRLVPYLPHLALAAAALTALRGVPETVGGGHVRLAVSLPALRSRRFRTVVAPLAPWVFGAPAIAFGLLPSVVGAGGASDGIALTAGVTGVCALAGVLVQPLARRLDARLGSGRPGSVGLLVLATGLVLGSLTAATGEVWMLVPSAAVLGSAYGLCFVAGLIEVQRMADARSLAGLTAVFYVLCYFGFAVPYLLSLAAGLAGYATLLAVGAGLAVATAAFVSLSGAAAPAPAPPPAGELADETA